MTDNAIASAVPAVTNIASAVLAVTNTEREVESGPAKVELKFIYIIVVARGVRAARVGTVALGLALVSPLMQIAG